MSGFPQKGRTFFVGMPLEPPRAGIRARISILFSHNATYVVPCKIPQNIVSFQGFGELYPLHMKKDSTGTQNAFDLTGRVCVVVGGGLIGSEFVSAPDSSGAAPAG